MSQLPVTIVRWQCLRAVRRKLTSLWTRQSAPCLLLDAAGRGIKPEAPGNRKLYDSSNPLRTMHGPPDTRLGLLRYRPRGLVPIRAPSTGSVRSLPSFLASTSLSLRLDQPHTAAIAPSVAHPRGLSSKNLSTDASPWTFHGPRLLSLTPRCRRAMPSSKVSWT